jgi:separase
MPSVGIIQALVIHRSLHEATKRKVENLASKIVSDEHFRANTAIVPSIDPYNAYFLLNPSGDLGSTQSAFEEMFKTQHGWEVGLFWILSFLGMWFSLCSGLI